MALVFSESSGIQYQTHSSEESVSNLEQCLRNSSIKELLQRVDAALCANKRNQHFNIGMHAFIPAGARTRFFHQALPHTG
jgi:hypothetical protein